MSENTLIKKIKVSAYTVPTDEHESDGTYEWDSTSLVLVEVSGGGKKGLGYSYTSTAAAELIKNHLAGIIINSDLLEVEKCWKTMLSAVRNIGSRGLAASAISAVDIALWDLKARFLNLPLTRLIGQIYSGVEVYGSGGFTSYSKMKLQKQLSGWVEEGIGSVKMKIGRDLNNDIERIKNAREAIGNNTRLYIDANGALEKKQALEFAGRVNQYNISWFEEPVSSDDLRGLSFLLYRLPPEMELAAGEYGYDLFYFKRMLELGAVDVLQADATRCLGITGFMKVSVLCEAHNICLSAHTAPAIHLHPCCSVNKVKNIEYFHDHVRIENLLFDGVQRPDAGLLYPDLSRHGLGLELKSSAAKNFRVL